MATATLIPANAQERTLMAELDNICKEFATRFLKEYHDFNSDDVTQYYDFISTDGAFSLCTDIEFSIYRDKSDDLHHAELNLENYDFIFLDKDGQDIPVNVRPEFVNQYLITLQNKCSQLI